MKLTINNIKYVKRFEINGITYHWFVAMESNHISDCRSYIHRENARAVVKQFGIELLPPTVRKFVESHNEELFYRGKYDEATQYIYR